MKKLYSTLCLIAAPALVFAQTEQSAPADAEATDRGLVSISQVPEERGGNVIWSEDFGNGWPAGWVADDLSGICAWKWSMNGSHGYWNGNNASTYDDPIQSTTGANGFLISDPDSSNHFNYGQPSGSTYQYLDTWVAIPSIDCSSAAAVKLEFEQMYRFNNSVDLIVEVSNDSSTWTSYTVQDPGAANNTQSADPEFVSVNISAVAGNQANVYIRIGWSARVYFWMIDDMAVVEAPLDDISLSDPRWDDYIEYHTYMTDQAQALTFSATLTNEGANAETNVALDVDVEDLGNSNIVYSGSSPASSFAFLFSDSVATTTTHMPNVPGDYRMHFTSSMDATDLVPANDSMTVDFWVDDTWYARDNNMYASQYWNGDDGNGNSWSYEYGTTYEIFNDLDIEQISIYVGPGTDAGVIMYGVIYSIDAQGNFVYEGQSNDYTITANDIDNWVTLTLSSPITILGGNEVIALAGHYGGADLLYVGRSTNTSPPQTSFLLDGEDNTWYYTTRVPMVRIGKLPVSVDEADKSQLELNAYPNPTQDILTLDFVLPEAAPVEFTVYDLTGRIVLEQVNGNMNPGNQIMTLDISSLASGNYQLNLKAGNLSTTQQIVVAK